MTSPAPAVRTSGHRLRTLGAAMVLTLLAQLIVGMANTFWLSLPESGPGWDAAAPALLLSAHLVVGTALLVLGVWIAVLAVRDRDRGWVIASGLGILGIVTAIGGGSTFMSDTSDDAASFVMAIGAAVAIASYALGLYPTTRTAPEESS
ncbi:MAG TPA: hypothetical protein VIJ41_07295 [Candidatus Nanopelagicales bacterium]